MKRTFRELVLKFSEVEGNWKIDFLKSPKEKGYIVVENGRIVNAKLKEGNLVYTGNTAVERFIGEADNYIAVKILPYESEETIFEKDEKVTLSQELIISLLKGEKEAEKAETVKTDTLYEEAVEADEAKGEEPSPSDGEELFLPFLKVPIPGEHILAYVFNGRVKKNNTKIPDEEFEEVVRNLTTQMVNLGKGSGEVILKGKKGGYYFRYQPGEVVFMLLTKEGMGDLLLSLEE